MKLGIFVLGAVVGGLLMAAVGSTHPKETQSALKSGADTITSSVSSGANAAQKYASDKLPEGKNK